MVEIKAEGNKRNRKVFLMKDLRDVNIVAGIDLIVEMQHKYSGQLCKYFLNKRERLTEQDIIELLKDFEETLKENNPEGFSSKDLLKRFIDALKEEMQKMLDAKLKEINEMVDESFANDKKTMLQLEDTKIRLDSYCSFQVKYSGVNVEIVKNQEGK